MCIFNSRPRFPAASPSTRRRGLCAVNGLHNVIFWFEMKITEVGVLRTVKMLHECVYFYSSYTPDGAQYSVSFHL